MEGISVQQAQTGIETGVVYNLPRQKQLQLRRARLIAKKRRRVLWTCVVSLFLVVVLCCSFMQYARIKALGAQYDLLLVRTAQMRAEQESIYAELGQLPSGETSPLFE